MIIETTHLSTGPKRFIGEEPASVLEPDDAFAQVKSPVRYDLHANLASNELVVQGMIEVDLLCQCSRCAEQFSTTIKVEDFTRSYKLTTKNESIDLTSDIREDILLSFPMNWICSSSCKGLCPHCGANLNKQICSCDKRETNTMWNTLDQLKLAK